MDDRYYIESDAVIATLITKVNDRIHQGWNVFGGLVWNGTTYLQPMVKN